MGDLDDGDDTRLDGQRVAVGDCIAQQGLHEAVSDGVDDCEDELTVNVLREVDDGAQLERYNHQTHHHRRNEAQFESFHQPVP